MNKNLIRGTMALLFVLVVCISSAAAVDDTVTRDLPDSAVAGATITVDLTVDVETGATYYAIDESVPSGWTVTSATGGGDYTSDPGHVKWLVLSGAADMVHSYTVDVPAGASGTYTFDGTYLFEGMTAEATILGDTTVTVGAVPPTLVIYTITNTTITPPQTTSIDVKFSERVSAIIKIEDASGNLVNKLYSSTGVTDPTPKTWDGTYTNGTTVPAGTYTVNVSGVSTTTGLSVVDTSKTITVVIPVVLTTITVSPATANPAVGDTQLFTATARDQYDAPMAGIIITWMSANTVVGTVDPASAATGADGTATTTFTAVAEGATTVAAINGSVYGTAAVTVTPMPTVVSIGSAEGSVGKTVDVSINITDASKIGAMDIRVTYDASILNATNVANGSMMQDLPDILWASNINSEGEVNISLATYPTMINGTGELFVVTFDIVGGDTGDSSILAINAEAWTGEVPPQSVTVAVENGYVTVTEPTVLTTITVSPAAASLTVGDTQLFTATAYDQFGDVMPDVVLTWVSTNTAVGTVDPLSAATGADGTATTTFTAVAEGTTNVAAINGSVYGTAAVTVTPPSPPVVMIATDASTYSPGDTMIVTLDIANPTSDPVTFEWYIGVPELDIWVTYARASIPAGFDNSYTIPIPVGNWGPTPFNLVHYVRMLDPVSGDVLVYDVAWCAYSPDMGEAMPVDIADEIIKTVERVEFSI